MTLPQKKATPARIKQALNEMLGAAVLAKDLERAKLCLQKGADPETLVQVRISTQGGYAAHLSVPAVFAAITTAYYSEDMANLLLAHGAGVDAPCPSNGMTPLLHATSMKDVKTVRFLLSKGADPFAADNAGSCPFDHAKNMPSDIALALLHKLPDVKKDFDAAARPTATTQKEIKVNDPFSVTRKPPAP